MRWIRVQANVATHPKAFALAEAMGVSRHHALGVIVDLWGWVSQHCPAGHIEMSHGTALGQYLGQAGTTTGQPGTTVQALVRVGLLDEVQDGWVVHDWHDFQGAGEAKAAKERERKRAYREAQRQLSRGQSADVPRTVPRDSPRHNETRRDETSNKQHSVELALDLVPAPPAEPPPPTPEQARREAEAKLSQDEYDVFEEWRVECKHPRAACTPKRHKLLKAALKLYSVEDLQRSIRGYARSPWHQGQNDRRQRYDDLELILRDAQHIERGLAMAANETPRLVAVNGPPGHESEATHG